MDYQPRPNFSHEPRPARDTDTHHRFDAADTEDHNQFMIKGHPPVNWTINFHDTRPPLTARQPLTKWYNRIYCPAAWLPNNKASSSDLMSD